MDAAADEEFFWERLLQAIDSGKVVPIIGREALQVDTPDGPQRHDQVVARRLAEALRLDLATLPPGFDLNDVVCRAANFRGGAPKDYLLRIVSICQGLQLPPPPALRSLARIPRLQLFVSLTFDTLLEQALQAERGRAPALGAYPAATDHVDFDPRLLETHGSMVFQLLGRLSALTRFAVTEGQTLELMHGVLTGDNRPARLIDRLRDSHLLLLGTGMPDWPSRFLLRMARPGPLWNDRDTDEIVADAATEGLPTFLHRFSPEHSLTYGGHPQDFTRELERRWFERYPPEAPAAPAAAGPNPATAGLDGDDDEQPADMAGGSVFISYARADRQAAFALADHLADHGLEVWVDRRLEPGAAYRRIIERNIVNCCAFVAVLSQTTQDPRPSWYRREWSIACKQNEVYFGTGSGFIFPVIVDHSISRDHTETLSLFSTHGTQAAKAPGGVADDALVLSLHKQQRQWRKLHAQRQ